MSFALIRGVFVITDGDVVEQTENYAPFDTLREAEEFHLTLPLKNESYYEIVRVLNPSDNTHKESDLRPMTHHQLFGIWLWAKMKGIKPASATLIACLDEQFDKLGREGVIAWLVQQRVRKS